MDDDDDASGIGIDDDAVRCAIDSKLSTGPTAVWFNNVESVNEREDEIKPLKKPVQKPV